MMIETAGDFYKAIAERRREERAAIKAFIEGAVSGDTELFSSGIRLVDKHCVWNRAFRAIARHSAAKEVRDYFQWSWLSSGDHIRGEVNSDLILIAGLRALLPPYRGSAIRLYRGDSAHNRRHRTYGLSWTANIDIARAHAGGIWRTFKGGSVVLTTVASPESTIWACKAEGDHYQEDEYVVDRRWLKVDVIERLSQISIREHAKKKKDAEQ